MPGIMLRCESLTDRAVGDGLVNLSSMSAVITVAVEKLNHARRTKQHEEASSVRVVLCVFVVESLFRFLHRTDVS